MKLPRDDNHLIDPVCLFHGLRRSEHECLYCCLCFRTLTRDECNILPNGDIEDVCKECAKMEEIAWNKKNGLSE